MLKKIVCILLAVILVCALCACKKQDTPSQNGDKQQASATQANATQKPAVTAAAPVDDSGNYTAETDEKTPLGEADPSAVLLTFEGLKQAQVTAGQLAELPLYEYSESTGEDTPVYRGPRIMDVLALIGAEGANKLVVTYPEVGVSHEFSIADIDAETSIFAVIKDGKLTDNSTLICSTSDGFNYVLIVDGAYTLN